MNRLPLPCYICGGIVVELKCTKCRKSWDNINMFAGQGHEYRQAQSAVLVADGGNLIELYQLQTQAKKYLDMIRFPPHSMAIDAVMDGEPLRFENDGEMADYILSIMNRSKHGE